MGKKKTPPTVVNPLTGTIVDETISEKHLVDEYKLLSMRIKELQVAEKKMKELLLPFIEEARNEERTVGDYFLTSANRTFSITKFERQATPEEKAKYAKYVERTEKWSKKMNDMQEPYKEYGTPFVKHPKHA